MRLTPSNWDQLEFRSADVHVRAIVDRNVWLVATNIFGAESLSEKWFAKDVRPVEFLFELFLIVASTIKLGTRVQAVEVRVTADMVPVGVGNEHSCQWRQSRRKGLQRFVCGFCGVRARARVNADQLLPVFGNHKVVFREFEAGQRVNTTGDDLCYAPRSKSMTRASLFRKWCCQCDGVIEVGIAAAMEILLGFCLIAIVQSESAEMIVDFAQPSRMRRFVCVFKTPGKFLLCDLSLAK
jgi:hypothetical protein